MEVEREVTPALARAILGGDEHVQVSLLKRHNHVYRLTQGDAVCYLKTYTKDWYGDDVSATAGCVEHEVAAYHSLAHHNLPTPDVVRAELGCDNPLGRPFIVTRQLAGASFTHWLAEGDASQFNACLERVGRYLGQMHSITFDRPGYLMADGPWMPDGGRGWQHRIWSAQQTQREALSMLAADMPRLSPDLVSQLEGLFSTIDTVLAPAFEPPHFTHGDCHAHQFFLYSENGDWQVSGVVDMEVASAGDCVADLLKVTIELAVYLPLATRWWEPLFQGYGQAPDFDLFRLRLLGLHEINFTCHGVPWPLSRQDHLTRLLQARTWAHLFDWR